MEPHFKNNSNSKRTRPARPPTKPPTTCPYCQHTHFIKKGINRKKLEWVQRWKCRSCMRTFGHAAEALRGHTYPPRTILTALMAYCTGMSYTQVSTEMKRRWRHNIPKSTIAQWVDDHKYLMTYLWFRDAGRKLYSPNQIIKSTRFEHKQVYWFKRHLAKIDLVINHHSRNSQHFAAFADYLATVIEACPHHLFQSSYRSSKIKKHFLNLENLVLTSDENAATTMAALVLPMVTRNIDRHDRIQEFMLKTDAATIAVEVPIWLDEAALQAVEDHYDIRIIPPKSELEEGRRRTITGHIDFVQVRGGLLHILDYKPDTRKEKPLAQLMVYALALSHLTGIPLDKMRCAWFSHKDYNEFEPALLLTR